MTRKRSLPPSNNSISTKPANSKQNIHIINNESDNVIFTTDADLRKRNSILEKRHIRDKMILNTVNRYWNQLNEDMGMLLQKFDSKFVETTESKNQSESTSRFLSQLSSLGEEELDKELATRVRASKDIVAKSVKVFDRLILRNEEIAAVMRRNKKDELPSKLNDTVRRAVIEAEMENRNLHILNTSFIEKCRAMSFKSCKLQELVKKDELEIKNLNHKIDRMKSSLSKMTSRTSKLETIITETVDYLKTHREILNGADSIQTALDIAHHSFESVDILGPLPSVINNYVEEPDEDISDTNSSIVLPEELANSVGTVIYVEPTPAFASSGGSYIEDVDEDISESISKNGSTSECIKSEIVIVNEIKNLDYNCSICKKEFLTLQEINSHFETQHVFEFREDISKSYFHCSECKKIFNTKTGLEKHMHEHDTKNPLKCIKCNKVFQISAFYKKHMQRKSCIPLYKCEQCPQTFKSPCYLKRHLLIHSNTRAFNCSTCNMRFTLETNLKVHMARHSNDRPYVCSICKKSFKIESALKSHIQIHANLKKYQCDQCDKSFNQNSGLQSHLQSHLTLKKFECNVCDKKFTTSGAITRHMFIHTGRKPFSCKLCGKCFTQAGNLRTHLRAHTQGSHKHRCDKCGQTFTRTSRYDEHMKFHALVERSLSQGK